MVFRRGVYDIGFINEDGLEDETEFYADELSEIHEFMRDEFGVEPEDYEYLEWVRWYDEDSDGFWTIGITFNEYDIQNQLPEDVYGYIKDAGLVETLAKRVVFAEEYMLSIRFADSLGDAIREAARNLVSVGKEGE